MPKKTTDLANEDYLNYYNKFIRINTLEEFINPLHALPQQVAVWRTSFFHHFIYLRRGESSINNAIEIDFIHKINKKPLKMAESLLSMLEADFIARVALKEVTVVYKDGKYVLKNGFSLLDFESGVYFLGDYTDEEREVARTKALYAVGLHEIYSGASCNCEHFSNWCFIDNPISFQADLMNTKANLADAGLNTCKGVTGLAVTNLAKQSAFVVATHEAVKSGVGAKIAQIALSPVKSSAVGVLIQAPIEAANLTYSCIKMKKAVSMGMMTQSDMNKEVTKNVFSSTSSLAGSFGLGVAGAAVGSCILPGPGTIVGGVTGSIIGGVGGKFGGTLLGAGAYKIAHKAKDKIKNIREENEARDSESNTIWYSDLNKDELNEEFSIQKN